MLFSCRETVRKKGNSKIEESQSNKRPKKERSHLVYGIEFVWSIEEDQLKFLVTVEPELRIKNVSDGDHLQTRELEHMVGYVPF